MSVDENVDGIVYYKERIQWQISHNFYGGSHQDAELDRTLYCWMLRRYLLRRYRTIIDLFIAARSKSSDKIQLRFICNESYDTSSACLLNTTIDAN